MENFPDTVSKVSIHPTNPGVYEITADAREELKPGNTTEAVLTKN
jgi:hypothetical protein